MPKPPNPTPSSRAQAVHAQAAHAHAHRTKPHHHQRAKHHLAQLQTDRHSLVHTLRDLTATRTDLLHTLERVDAANAPPGESDRLRGEIEQAERRVRECHQRWDELGEQIEERHGEIAFGGSDDDQGRREG